MEGHKCVGNSLKQYKFCGLMASFYWMHACSKKSMTPQGLHDSAHKNHALTYWSTRSILLSTMLEWLCWDRWRHIEKHYHVYNNFTFSNNSGSGQQCCYDKHGNLITGPNSGGTADLVAPKKDSLYKTYYRHLLEDIIPAIYCCKGTYRSATCSLYYEERPSDKGEMCESARPGRLSTCSCDIIRDGTNRIGGWSP